MITEILTLACGGKLAHTLFQINKSTKIEEAAMLKYAKAFSKEQEAKRLIENKEKETDASILKLARRKKAIIDTTITSFVDIYEKVQKINFQGSTGISELTSLALSNADVSQLKAMSISCRQPFTEKELVIGLLFKGTIFGGGVGGMAIKESERTLSAASSQYRAANVIYSQAETIAVVYDSIKKRADRMADLLKKMNVLTVRGISETKRLLSEKGNNVKMYSESDKRIIMNCINFVKATKDILDAPLFNQNGQLEEQAMIAISNGEAFIEQINQAI